MSFINKQTLSETSAVSPALTVLANYILLAWTGENSFLNINFSTDNGNTFGGKFTTDQTSPAAPSICSFQVFPYMVWTGVGNDQVNFVLVDFLGDILGVPVIEGIAFQQTLQETTQQGPSIASLGNLLFIAWAGNGNNLLNIAYMTDGGSSFGHKFTSGETSALAPSICEHNGSLYIAWTGSGNGNLNVAKVNISGVDIVGFTNVTLGETSQQSPSIASFGGNLYIAWTGSNNELLNVAVSTDHGLTFPTKFTSTETSPQGPSLAAGSSLFIAWTGNGNNNLNVAAVTPLA